MNLCHLILTTGSPRGIGLEISEKSIQSLKPKSNMRISLVIPKSSGPFTVKGSWKLKKGTLACLNSWKDLAPNEVQVIRTSLSASGVVKRSVAHCLKDPGSAMVNAPMRKTKDGGGHTEIIRDLSGAKDLKMAFVGKKFNLCLATTHIPVDQVHRSLTKNVIEQTAKACLKLHEITNSAGPVGLLGLNPHAGENGSISDQDEKIMNLIRKMKISCQFTQMLPPDGSFIGGPPAKTVLAWYHDQGLIPFKTVHGLSQGIQVTLGIPFIRTSVDHGTAEDLYSKGVADFRSMKMAIEMARKFQLKFGNTLID